MTMQLPLKEGTPAESQNYEWCNACASYSFQGVLHRQSALLTGPLGIIANSSALLVSLP